jgi:hypothetical protein
MYHYPRRAPCGEQDGGPVPLSHEGVYRYLAQPAAQYPA